jgi:hypothetical protein
MNTLSNIAVSAALVSAAGSAVADQDFDRTKIETVLAAKIALSLTIFTSW